MIKPFSLPSNHSLNFVKGWPEDKQDSLASSLVTANMKLSVSVLIISKALKNTFFKAT